jgi:two-component system, LytTR family, response regulator
MLNCIAIDDEPLALDLMEEFISKVTFLNLINKCNRAVEAIEIIQKNKVDLIFLDIQMPDINGIQLLKSIKDKPMVIFTTAFEQYAIESYELDVIDYLLKPIPFDRFIKAANKALEYNNLRNKLQTHNSNSLYHEMTHDFFFVKSEYQNIKINFADILYIEGLKDYIKIFLSSKEKPVLTLMSLKSIEEKLPQSNFVRVHRSYIISINKIDALTKSIIHVGDKEIPVGELYIDNVLKILKDTKSF